MKKYFKWNELIQGLENIQPIYSIMNKLMSFNKDLYWRIKSIKLLKNEGKILDLGSGIGYSTILLLKELKECEEILMLDSSYLSLKFGIKNKKIDKICAVFENIPLKEKSIDNLFASFSIRDSINLYKAYDEIKKILKYKGNFAILDVGKSDFLILRLLFEIFLRFFIPLIAYIVSRDLKIIKIYKFLYITYSLIPKNKEYIKFLQKKFNNVNFYQFFGGCVIIIYGFK